MSEFEIQQGPIVDDDAVAAKTAKDARILGQRQEAARKMREARDRKKDALQKRKAEIRTRDTVRNAPAPQPAQRAEAPRDPLGDEPVTRRRRSERQLNTFDLPSHAKKPGWDYEWKTIRVFNQPVDGSELMDHREAGWRPEKSVNWPMLCEPGTPPDTPIERGGMRLYARPLTLTMEAKTEDYKAANEQQRDRMLAAATGQSAMRGQDGLGSTRGVRSVPLEIQIEGVSGSGTGVGSHG